MRMKLHFVDCRTNLSILKHQLELGDGHIRGADVANQAPFDQFLHSSPCFHVISMDVRLGIFVASSNITTWRVKIRERPMNKVQIKITEPQIRQRLFAGGNNIFESVLVIPDLGSKPQLLALNTAGNNFRPWK